MRGISDEFYNRLVDKSFFRNRHILEKLGTNWTTSYYDKDGGYHLNRKGWNPSQGHPIKIESRISKNYGQIGNIIASNKAEYIQKNIRKVLKQTFKDFLPFKGDATKKSYFVLKKRIIKKADFNTWNVGFATGTAARKLADKATYKVAGVYEEHDKTITIRYNIPPEVSIKLAPASKSIKINGGRTLHDSLVNWIRTKNINYDGAIGDKNKESRMAFAIMKAWKIVGKPPIANDGALSISRNPVLKERFSYYLRQI